VLLVYRDVVQEVSTRERFSRIRDRIAVGDAVGALIIAGEIEQGVIDAIDTWQDDWTDVHANLRMLVQTAAAVARGHATARDLFGVADAALATHLPATISCRAPEGYCHYALDPLGYARAAATYAADGRRCALAIGVRSIGTSLAAVVADVLKAPSITVRARGESGARRVIASRQLRRHAVDQLSGGGDVAIVDEGPGATGETFEVVAHWCRELGVADDRIVLFASHAGNSRLAPHRRQQWLESAIRYTPPADDRGRAAAEAAGFDCAVSISAGQWRQHVASGHRLPAVCNFERTKYLARRNGQWWQIRYAGAGEWGDSIIARTCSLAERSCVSRAKPLKHGFIAQPWVDGTPLTRRSLQPMDASRAARYLTARHALFPTGAPVARERFIAILSEHGAEAGISAGAIAAAARRIESLPERQAFICDARLAPQEWIRTPTCLWKVDAVDHGDGFRLPGPTDAMWDFAGWLVEFEAPLSAFDDALPGMTAEDRHAAAAYAPVYAAVAFGDLLLSAREAADPQDRRKLLREARVYRAAMRRWLR